MNEEVSLYDMVNNIVTVVINTHYKYITDPELKKDLKQQGFLKAYELLHNGNYDPSMALRNFLYTGIRNEIHNTLYHMNKVQQVDLSELDKYDNIVGYHDMGDYEISIRRLQIVNKLFKRNNNYLPMILNYLNQLGLISNYTPQEEETIDEQMKDGVKALVLWELYEEELQRGKGI